MARQLARPAAGTAAVFHLLAPSHAATAAGAGSHHPRLRLPPPPQDPLHLLPDAPARLRIPLERPQPRGAGDADCRQDARLGKTAAERAALCVAQRGEVGVEVQRVKDAPECLRDEPAAS